MLAPTVHRNGTSGTVLIEEYSEQIRTVRIALETMNSLGPNARDYYPQGDYAYRTARAGYVTLLESLESVLSELTEVRDSIQSQIDAKDR